MDFQAARLAMVESQIRPNGVRDPLILNAFATVPREAFVPNDQKALAYMDDAALAVPAAGESPARYLLPPMVLAKLLQSASLSQSDQVLDIGGATGYSAAILAQICSNVAALEASEDLADIDEAEPESGKRGTCYGLSRPAQSGAGGHETL